jgi:hypothetical protein
VTTTTGESTTNPVDVPAESARPSLSHAQLERIVATASLASSRVGELEMTRTAARDRIMAAARVEIEEIDRWFEQETEVDREKITFAEMQMEAFMRARLAADPEGKKSTSWPKGRVASRELPDEYERHEPVLFAWAAEHGFTRKPDPKPVTDWERLKAAADVMEDGSLFIPEVGAVPGVTVHQRKPNVTVTIYDR